MEMILLLHKTEPSGREARVNDQRPSTKQLASASVLGAYSVNNSSAMSGTAGAPS